MQWPGLSQQQPALNRLLYTSLALTPTAYCTQGEGVGSKREKVHEKSEDGERGDVGMYLCDKCRLCISMSKMPANI